MRLARGSDCYPSFTIIRREQHLARQRQPRARARGHPRISRERIQVVVDP